MITKVPIPKEILDNQARREKDSIHKCPNCGKTWDCADEDSNGVNVCSIDYMCNCGNCN